MKKHDLSRCAPPGINLKQERQFFLTGMICAELYSMLFLLRYGNARSWLFEQHAGQRMLIPGAIMEDFVTILSDALVGFLVLSLCMLVLIVYHYAYHYQGSKSIYLMRRLPSSWELHRRCLTLPLLAVLCCALAALILLLIYYGIYLFFTPKSCLVPGQWQKIWSVLL